MFKFLAIGFALNLAMCALILERDYRKQQRLDTIMYLQTNYLPRIKT
jgi:hypothetical protein